MNNNIFQNKNIFRGILLVLGICLIMTNLPGYCQMEKIKRYNSKKSQKDQLKESESDDMKVKNIPAGEYSFDEVPLVADARVDNMQDTIEGLKDVGYSLDEIVTVLKNDNKNAPQISMACLKAGYNGTKIYNSLQKAGFSKGEA